MYQGAQWNEIQVVNTKTQVEISVPRRFVGEISAVGEPVMIVGLLKELEYKEGIVVPHVRRVIEMPRAVNDWPGGFAQPAPHEILQGASRPRADVVGIRIEAPRESRTKRMVFGLAAVGLLVCATVAVAFRDAVQWTRTNTLRASLVDLPFSVTDGEDAIVRRLGVPTADDRRSSGGLSYRRLWYSRYGFSVILIGDRYAGVVDARGRILQSTNPAIKNLR